MSNHRWNVEVSYYEYFKGDIKRIRFFGQASSKKGALNLIKKIDNKRIKLLSWSSQMWRQY